MVKKYPLYAVLTVLFNCHILKFSHTWEGVCKELIGSVITSGNVEDASDELTRIEPRFLMMRKRFADERGRYRTNGSGLPVLPIDFQHFFFTYYGVTSLEDEVFLRPQKASFDQIEFVRW